MDTEAYISFIDTAMDNAENGISNISDEIKTMNGNTGIRTRHFYNNLLNLEDVRYLDIGTLNGSSVCAAMCNKSAKVVSIDDWTTVDSSVKEEFITKFEEFKGSNDASYIDCNYFQESFADLGKFNIMLYDGDHATDSHDKVLARFYDHLDDIFILVVDDWNMLPVREQIMASINAMNLKTIHERTIRLTWDDSFTSQPQASHTWWNGMFVAVLQKQ